MEKNVSFNDKVRAILDDKDSEIKKLPWSKKYLVNCLQADNPLISQSALLLSKQKTGGSNNTINLFSEKSRPIHFQKIEEAPAFWGLMKASNAKMLSDVTDKSKPPKIQKNDFNDLPSPDYCFYQKNKAHRRILTIEDKSLSGPTKGIFAGLEIRDIKYDFEMIEPLFFGVFLIQNGSIINEQWTSAFKGNDQFISNTSVSSKAYIELPLSYNNAFLCVVISRFLLPENGSAVDLYYQNQSVKALQSAKMQTKFFNKFICVFAPFALTFVDVKTVIDNKYFDMAPPFAISKPLHVILKQIKNGQKIDSETYPIHFAFNSSIIETFNIQLKLSKNVECFKLTKKIPSVPNYSFRHSILIKVNHLNTEKSVQNVFAELRIKNERGDLEIF